VTNARAEITKPQIKGGTMKDEDLEVPPDLTPDSIAKRLGGAYPAIPPGYVSFKGYLAAERDGLHRLFRDDGFQHWIEVRAKDIAARINVPTNERDARSVLYVKRKARVITSRVQNAYDVGELDVDPGGSGGAPGPPPWHTG
jgi:hypothetical protein